MNSSSLVEGGIYRHYKGKNYRFLKIVHHSETLKPLALYECLYENDIGQTWVRPLEMFSETVEVDGKQVPRFVYVGSQKGHERF